MFFQFLSRFFTIGKALSRYFFYGLVLLSGLFASEKYLGIDIPFKKEYIATAMLAFFIIIHLIYLLIKRLVIRNFEKKNQSVQTIKEENVEPQIDSHSEVNSSIEILRTHINRRFGRFWRRKIKIITVVGSPQVVSAFLPGLIEEGWQINDQALLIWSGNVDEPLNPNIAKFIKSIDKSPIDSVVWAVMPDELEDIALINYASTYLFERETQLKWRAPLYLWVLNHANEVITPQQIFPIGVFLPKRTNTRYLENNLKKLIHPLAKIGAKRVIDEGQKSKYSYLLNLSHRLDNSGATSISSNLASFLNSTNNVFLKGVFFSPLTSLNGNQNNQTVRVRPVHSWFSNDAWNAIVNAHSSMHGQAIGPNWEKGVQFSVFSLLFFMVAGSSVSYLLNKSAIEKLEERLVVINKKSITPQQRLGQQVALQNDLEKIQYEIENGSAIITRFGLNRNKEQLDLLWKHYDYAILPFIQKGATQRFENTLFHWTELKASKAKNEQLQKLSYDTLKAYLMLANPEKADPKFLTHQLTHAWLNEADIPESVWQTSGYQLLSFFATELPNHPQWAIERDVDLVSQSRNALLREIGFNNAESALYQSILKGARNYQDITLEQLIGQTDYSQLFYMREGDGESQSVPGIFTRQAYEGQIKNAITKAVENRQEDVDWVLSDNPTEVQEKESPEALEARLKNRYFTDFSYAWLHFLNKIRWVNSNSISHSIDQLSLVGDPRQSPVLALFESIKYQSATGTEKVINTPKKSVDDTLNQLISKEPVIQTENEEYKVPEAMAATFGPLLNMLDVEKSNTDLSLQTYITRITRLRLKLQQAANTANPDAVMRGIAQTVFQGTSIDLADTRDFGHLMSESLGSEWSGLGQSVFVQPLEQTWQGVLGPSTNSINNQWKQSIVNEWNQSFQGRYPFTKTTNDSSMPLLGEFIRPNTGRIDQFISKQLAGVLQKEGNQWVPNVLNTQGLSFNPEFLEAINLLNEIADIMYLTGDANVNFEILARPTTGVTETQLMIDGQLMRYFNQAENWQPFSWPGNLLNTGTRLTWGSESGGISVLSEQSGSWGLIRLLSQANVKQLDSSTFQLTFKTNSGLPIVYILRTQIGQGPLALLKMKQFKLPDQIFQTNGRIDSVELDDSSSESTELESNYTHSFNSIPTAWQGGEEDNLNAITNEVSELTDIAQETVLLAENTNVEPVAQAVESIVPEKKDPPTAALSGSYAQEQSVIETPIVESDHPSMKEKDLAYGYDSKGSSQQANTTTNHTTTDEKSKNKMLSGVKLNEQEQLIQSNESEKKAVRKKMLL